MPSKSQVAISVLTFIGAFFISYHLSRGDSISRIPSSRAGSAVGPSQLVIVVSPDENIWSHSAGGDARSNILEAVLAREHAGEPLVIVVNSDPASINAALTVNGNESRLDFSDGPNKPLSRSSVPPNHFRSAIQSASNLLETCNRFLRKIAV